MPLTMASPGSEVVIVRIQGKDEQQKFLENLGFVIGAKISVISDIQGNLIVNIKDSRVAISKSMANRIFVSEE
ncbi:MAG: FeoA family protein [Andreesenia angusta]|nr:FeoA family protein [Andreesenia angusta]